MQFLTTTLVLVLSAKFALGHPGSDSYYQLDPRNTYAEADAHVDSQDLYGREAGIFEGSETDDVYRRGIHERNARPILNEQSLHERYYYPKEKDTI
ncbi:hypothetical protein MMC34_008373, partial [Xylographa carneopallida]|nr:hypothetical protein [Xylographa carneopallida]